MELNPSDYEEMQRRIALICRLPNGRLPKKIAPAPRYLIRIKTGKWSWAYYDEALEEVRFLKEYENLIPHELCHHLQTLNGLRPASEECEAQAYWLQSIYWKLWP